MSVFGGKDRRRDRLLEGSPRNIKITVPDDLIIAEYLLKAEKRTLMHRIGFGNDVHRLVSGRPLIIGGVEFESEFGADGHSDADVLMHAITDALLGSLALGDIGSHFPDTEERWRSVESSVFLKYALGLIRSVLSITNIDSTIDLERPKLREYIDIMRKNIAAALEIDVSQVSKSEERRKVDAVGEGRAVGPGRRASQSLDRTHR
jgi:2-C-methyl-D-erythritol 2,4-cyclodiphosphate synthase